MAPEFDEPEIEPADVVELAEQQEAFGASLDIRYAPVTTAIINITIAMIAGTRYLFRELAFRIVSSPAANY
jgi:hypothetical protein